MAEPVAREAPTSSLGAWPGVEQGSHALLGRGQRGSLGRGLCPVGEGPRAGLTSSRSGGRRSPSSTLRRRTGALGCSSILLSAPSAAPTSLASPSPNAPRSAGSSTVTCRTCAVWDCGQPPSAPAPSPTRPCASPSHGSAPGGRGQAGPTNALSAQGRPAKSGAAPG